VTDTPVNLLAPQEAASRLRSDHELLLGRVAGLSGEQLAAGYRVSGGPLGDFCESLHDLVAHVLMWDEISLAVLSEAGAGRVHWSLDRRWETGEAGRRLNRGGVAAGREVPADLLLHRLRAVHAAVLAEIGRYGERAWTGAGIGAVAQRAWTVPGAPAFWHAAVHLGVLPLIQPAAGAGAR
jgi:hypothetical protein